MARLAHPLQSQNDVIGLNEMMVLEVVTFGETKGGDTMGIIKVKTVSPSPFTDCEQRTARRPNDTHYRASSSFIFRIYPQRGQQNAPLKSNEK